jgi:hypothetical protein
MRTSERTLDRLERDLVFHDLTLTERLSLYQELSDSDDQLPERVRSEINHYFWHGQVTRHNQQPIQ